ncbi:trypsin-like serine protease [Dermatophilaceae bacterium Sec6.4]
MPFLSQAVAVALTAIAPMFPLPASLPISPQAHSLQAVSVSANPTVAALFGASSETSGHTCTASVVSSTTRNLLITAAHCVSGTGKGTGITVAPGYDAGSTPYGVWSVTDVFMDAAWKASQSDPDDVAILQVAPRVVNGATRELQDVTGANNLGDTPASATTVTVQGFNTGTGDRAISCTTGLDFTRDNNPTFGCAGYVGGSSGSPWLVTSADGTTLVTGVIGGLNQGGCTSRTSYSPVFGTAVAHLLARAESADSFGDTTPAAGTPSGCDGSS